MFNAWGNGSKSPKNHCGLRIFLRSFRSFNYLFIWGFSKKQQMYDKFGGFPLRCMKFGLVLYIYILYIYIYIYNDPCFLFPGALKKVTSLWRRHSINSTAN